MALPFVLVEPHRLENQSDGRQLALEVIRALRDAGRKRCSAHPDDRKPRQKCSALLAALNRLCDGSPQARAGFSVVLADLLGGTLAGTQIPEEYEHRERMSRFMRWRGTAILKEDREDEEREEEPQPKKKPKPEKKGVDWGALNPGRKMRQAPSPKEGPPESAEPGKARSPDQDRPK